MQAELEREADEEEAAEAEQPRAAEPEPEPEPEPQAISQTDIEALERENFRHEKTVAKIMGDDFRMVAVCPSCSAFGFIWPPPPVRGPAHAQHKLTETCATCNGYGDVLTGSRRSGNELIRCGDCKGYGYTPNPVTNPAAFSDIPAAPAQSAVGGSPPPAAAAEPVTPTSEDPRVAALRAEGFIVMPPVQQPAPTH